MNREIKFRAWDDVRRVMFYPKFLEIEENHVRSWDGNPASLGKGYNAILMQYTGLKDKNGKEGYFDSDVWEIKNYEYRVKYCEGYKRKECDLRFILKQGLLEVEFELVNPPLDLDHITLATIFNLKGDSGKRIFVDRNRQKLEIIGNIYENPELMEAGDV